MEGEKEPTREWLHVYGERVENDDCFDAALFGMLLKKMRKDRGYKTAEAFCRAVHEETGYRISYQIYYRIENGTRAITLAEYMAISLFLFGAFDAPGMRDAIGLCLGTHWKNLLELHKGVEDGTRTDEDFAQYHAGMTMEECPF